MKPYSRILFFVLAIGGVVYATTPQPAVPTAKADQALLLDVARAGKRLVAVGERGHIVVSADEGKTWRQANVPTRALLTTVHFVDEREGWAVGHDSTILHTADGGDTWQLQHSAQFDQAAIDAEYDQQMAAEEAPVGEEDPAADAAVDAPPARGASRAQRIGAALLDAWFADAKHGIAVGAYGLVLQTDDGGKTWVDHSDRVHNPEGWHLNGVAAVPSSPGVVFVVGEKGMVFRSADGGSSFSRVQSPVESSLFGVVGVSDAVYAFGLQGKLMRGNAAGAWAPVTTGVTFGFNDAVALPDGSLVVVGNAGVVVTVVANGAVSSIRRNDGKAVMAAVVAGSGLLVVGEAGAKLARANGATP